MEIKDALYFIAIVPPEEIRTAIMEFKHDFSDRFGSVYPLKVITHITLKSSFKVPPLEETKLFDWFKNMPITIKSFSLMLKDFGSFDNYLHPVVYVNPVRNTSLAMLQNDIFKSFKIHYPELGYDTTDKKFHPHMTVAYRDLSIENFKQAWKEYSVKKYESSFDVKDICLLKHDYIKWNIVSTRALS